MSVHFLRVCAFNVMLAAMLVLSVPLAAKAEPPSPFDKLAGRWVGEGRFGVRDGTTEAVKCRVTYILAGDSHDELKQSIRCASAGGNVFVVTPFYAYLSGGGGINYAAGFQTVVGVAGSAEAYRKPAAVAA